VRLSLVGIALPLLVILAACDLSVSNTVSLGNPCSMDSDCPSGQACFSPGAAGSPGGTCQETCNTKSDCAPGFACLEYGGESVCVAPGLDASPDASTAADATLVDAQDKDVCAAADGEAGATGASDALDAGDAIDATEKDDDAGVATDAAADTDGASDAGNDAADAADGATDAENDAADATDDASDAADGSSDAAPVCNAAPVPSTLVLFGGLNDTGDLQDTWIWNGQSWSQRDDIGDAGQPNASASPGPRHDAAMSSSCGYAVVLGGISGPSAEFLTDAWQWNGAVWQVMPSAPPARSYASAATLDGVMYLFGGNDSTGNPSATLFASRGGEWGPASQSTPAALYPRYGGTLANGPDGLVLFGGFDILGDTFSDTWLLTDTGWQLLGDDVGATVPGDDFGPGFGFAAAATWGTAVVLFGGQDGNGSASPDTWIWDGSTWTVAPRQSNGPAARSQAAMASLNGQVVLFGGLDSQAHILGDTWIWNGSWTPGPDAGPPARYVATMTSY
jgi:hypothetical protein